MSIKITKECFTDHNAVQVVIDELTPREFIHYRINLHEILRPKGMFVMSCASEPEMRIHQATARQKTEALLETQERFAEK